MSNEIQKANGVNGTALMVFTVEQKELIKRTCAPGATDDELAMFLHVAAKSGLDPLRRQIHFIKVQGRVVMVADVNGLQARAAKESDYEGLLHAVVYEKDEFAIDNVTGRVLKHTSNPLGNNGAIIGAWATVQRKGMLPFTAVVRFNEYRNQNNPLWGTKPAVMIDKCAKSTALRLAYPEQLGSIYDEAELDNEVELNPPPPSSSPTPPKTAADAKAQLAARLKQQNRDLAEAEIVEPTPPKPKMAISDESKPHPWERIKARGAEAGMSAESAWEAVKTLTGRQTRKDLTEADAVRFSKWLLDEPAEDFAKSPPNAAPQSAPAEADVPF